jgi:hypothetical protein
MKEYVDNKQLDKQNELNMIKEYIDNKQQLDNQKENNIMKEYVERKHYLDTRDRKVLYDDFAPPEKRVPEYLYPFNHVKNRLNIPTRGYPENYQVLGVLLRENTETAYNLFGRQTYPGSDLWEYYCENDKLNPVKLPVKIRGNKEIMEGDMVHVPGTDNKNGQFRVKLYKFDEPRYVPIL